MYLTKEINNHLFELKLTGHGAGSGGGYGYLAVFGKFFIDTHTRGDIDVISRNLQSQGWELNPKVCKYRREYALKDSVEEKLPFYFIPEYRFDRNLNLTPTAKDLDKAMENLLTGGDLVRKTVLTRSKSLRVDNYFASAKECGEASKQIEQWDIR